jgi:hypothetical protein
MSFHVRVCRECGEEYRPDIVRCADCGGELEDVFEDRGRPARRPAASEPEPPDLSDHRSVYESTRAADILPLAERLRESGVSFRLAEKAPAGEGAPVLFALLVPEGQSRAALVALAPLLAPPGDDAGFHAVETSYEDGRYVRCPACGAEPPAGAAECPGCGLALASDIPTCDRCGAFLPSPGAECPACGGPSLPG